jgi:ribonuclease VapC
VSDAVLDTSAVLAILNSEPGAETAIGFIGRAAISSVNLSEIISKLTERGASETGARSSVAALQLEVVPFTEEHAFIAGFLRVETRQYGLSLGDRSCLATATTLNFPVVTADRTWAQLLLPVDVILIR